MPQITVERSPYLDHVDWEEFALALHQLVVETADAKLEACKTRVLRGEDEAVGGEKENHAIVNVTLALLAGRSEETKAKLAGAVVELLRKHVGPADGLTVHLSAEVRDLDPSYTKAVL
ncbi:5-carboxymethyl-2-hydroxymuconate isomerase [Streptomyces sp. SAI-135]|uniref:5-carboxymethyl-2-hydroxymuconate Delta-isomerase n=1 Tax=unclassified Streptomyces TaxID=2593676 RepID=UPI002475B246|nr:MULTISPECIES: isomerase [unclassified Streptomyces]MDH6519542.1 5-carboxymethyl-2-hydroxymuconate isomerase [Streptomyces sp. SAI-090]MDH6616365.1 5-carboxymethyl-2-hydroxymuconate isomerase [Streptomyces sp. SAI-135]